MDSCCKSSPNSDQTTTNTYKQFQTLPYPIFHIQLTQDLSSKKNSREESLVTLVYSSDLLKISDGFQRLSVSLQHLQLSFSEIGHDVAQLGSADEAVAITIEDLEGFNQLLFSVGILHLARHQRQELGEVNCSVAICVNLVDHVLQFSLGGVLIQRSHHGSQLFGGDGAIAILVEQREGLLELCDLLFSQLVRHGKVSRVAMPREMASRVTVNRHSLLH